MRSTKTIIPLDRWYQAIQANEEHILRLAKSAHLVIFDIQCGYLQPVQTHDLTWKLEPLPERE